MSAKAIAKAILSALGEGGVHHISLPPEEIRILCEAVLAPRPEDERLDAERYRWLKANHLQTGPDSWIRTGDDLEEAIDAGMRESSKPQERSSS